jgi:hypothetical protein
MAWRWAIFACDQELTGHAKVGHKCLISIEFKP